jgi:hypothetical protein
MAERFVLYSSSLDPFSNHQEEKRASIPMGPVETSALEQRIKLALAPELPLDSLGKRLNDCLTETV